MLYCKVHRKQLEQERNFHIIININYCTWYFYKRLFGSSFATSRLVCSEFHFQLTKKS